LSSKENPSKRDFKSKIEVEYSVSSIGNFIERELKNKLAKDIDMRIEKEFSNDIKIHRIKQAIIEKKKWGKSEKVTKELKELMVEIIISNENELKPIRPEIKADANSLEGFEIAKEVLEKVETNFPQIERIRLIKNFLDK